jgi:L,D-transpeptidase-like protein
MAQIKNYLLACSIAAAALVAVVAGLSRTALTASTDGSRGTRADLVAQPYTGGLLDGLEPLQARAQERAVARRSGTLPRLRTLSLAAAIEPGARVRAYARPGRRALARLRSTTEYGSPRVMPIERREGEWLRVLVDAGSRRSAWIRWSERKLDLRRLRWSLAADRSAGTLKLLDRGRVEQQMVVGVGRPGSETPLGRFAVTDKLSGASYAGAYGCCILALTGRQIHLPAGWTGGDRLAIHATERAYPASGGSAGCIVGSNASLQYLMMRVPVGTVVTVRR